MRHEKLDAKAKGVVKLSATDVVLRRVQPLHPFELIADQIETRGVPYDQSTPDRCILGHARVMGFLKPKERRYNNPMAYMDLHSHNCACSNCTDWPKAAALFGIGQLELQDIYTCQKVLPRASKREAAQWLRQRARELQPA